MAVVSLRAVPFDVRLIDVAASHLPFVPFPSPDDGKQRVLSVNSAVSWDGGRSALLDTPPFSCSTKTSSAPPNLSCAGALSDATALFAVCGIRDASEYMRIFDIQNHCTVAANACRFSKNKHDDRYDDVSEIPKTALGDAWSVWDVWERELDAGGCGEDDKLTVLASLRRCHLFNALTWGFRSLHDFSRFVSAGEFVTSFLPAYLGSHSAARPTSSASASHELVPLESDGDDDGYRDDSRVDLLDTFDALTPHQAAAFGWFFRLPS